MSTITKTVSIDVDIDVDDVLDRITDADLATYDLMRVTEDAADHHQSLFAAVERGDFTAAFAAAEQIAWTMYGRILTGRMAA